MDQSGMAPIDNPRGRMWEAAHVSLPTATGTGGGGGGGGGEGGARGGC